MSSDAERVADWVRWYRVSHLKMNALCAVLENDAKLLPKVLDALGLESALDVIAACVNDGKK